MNEFANQMTAAKAITDQTNQTLKNLFRQKINGSFLIKMKSEVIKQLGVELLDHYSMQFDYTRVATGINDAPEFDLCKMIIGIHQHHSIFLSEEEIRRNQKDANYQKQLVAEVIEKVRLRKYSGVFFRKQPFQLGDEFLYFPVPYELFTMCTKSISLTNGNASPLSVYYRFIIQNALAALTLLENNLLSNAYPLCRGMIEQYIKTLLLQRHPEALDAYAKFCSFEIEQSCCTQTFPDEFIELYENRLYSFCTSKVDYLHYGWLDAIASTKGARPKGYSIYKILDYLKEISNTEDQNILFLIEQLYKMCHGYAHGSVAYVRYPLLQYFEISTMLYYVVKAVFVGIHTELGIDRSVEDMALISMLDRDFDILNRQYHLRTTENFERYYSVNH